MVKMNEEWLTAQEAAHITGYSVAWIGKLAARGDIEAMKWSGRWVICAESLKAYKPRKVGRPREIDRPTLRRGCPYQK